MNKITHYNAMLTKKSNIHKLMKIIFNVNPLLILFAVQFMQLQLFSLTEVLLLIFLPMNPLLC